MYPFRLAQTSNIALFINAALISIKDCTTGSASSAKQRADKSRIGYGLLYGGWRKESWACQDFPRIMSHPKNRVGYLDNTLKRKAKAPRSRPEKVLLGLPAARSSSESASWHVQDFLRHPPC